MHEAADVKETAARKLKLLAQALKPQRCGSDVQREIDGCEKRAEGLLQQARTLRAKGTNCCLDLIAKMPRKDDFRYLVQKGHITGFDQPTSFCINKRDEDNKLAEKIWRGEIDPTMALRELRKILPENQWALVPEVARRQI